MLIRHMLPRGEVIVALYEAYIDESGTHEGSPASVVGGYVIRSDNAEKMLKEWQQVLQEYGLPYFHMVDCAHRAPPFDKLAKSECIAIEKKMITLIKRYTFIGFVNFIPPAKHFPIELTRDIYVSCIWNAICSIIGEIKAKDWDGQVSIFIEQGHDREADAISEIKNFAMREPERIIKYAAVKKTEQPLIQAADLLVWQCHKYVKDKIIGTRLPRKDYINLVEHNSYFGYFAMEKGGIIIFSDRVPHVESEMRDQMIRDFFTRSSAFENPAIRAAYDLIAGKIPGT